MVFSIAVDGQPLFEVKTVSETAYVEDQRVMTSAGTAAGLDCCLAVVRSYYGVKIANKLARLLVIPPHREGGQAQFIEQPIARKTTRENINQVLLSMRKDLAKNYTLDTLATRLKMSRSTFIRHFRKATGVSLNQWLIDSRLQQGRDLLESTHMTVEEIAERIGFHSAISFRQHFKRKHQMSPKQWQKQFTSQENT
ncbi:GlxA family transcriptional regulator [Pelistega europaea]|nr:helix-turn-helix domain-containing protein [Pelistega europaea]